MDDEGQRPSPVATRTAARSSGLRYQGGSIVRIKHLKCQSYFGFSEFDHKRAALRAQLRGGQGKVNMGGRKFLAGDRISGDFPKGFVGPNPLGPGPHDPGAAALRGRNLTTVRQRGFQALQHKKRKFQFAPVDGLVNAPDKVNFAVP